MNNQAGRFHIAVFSEDIVYRSEDGSFFSGNPLPILYRKLAQLTGSVVLSSPTVDIASKVDNSSAIPPICISGRPYYEGSVVGFFRNLPRIFRPTLKNIDVNVRQADLVMIRLPSPIGIVVWRKAKALKKPVFLYIAGDIREVAVRGDKYKGLVRVCVALAAQIFHHLTRHMAKGSLVFTIGSALYEEFQGLAKRCVNLIPSVVSEQDIVFRSDACERESIRLLYVGRLVPVKGLRYLLEALPLLWDRKIAAKLWIVGDGYHRSALEDTVSTLKLQDHVHFLGRIPFGPKLFEIYRQADLFVLPSLSEGIPKTLLEAMASGVPIVATRVGGIPDVIQHGKTGLLVKPRSPRSLAEAIEQIVRDKSLRKRIVRNAYAFVREHTVEKQAERMWGEIQSFFSLEER